MTKDNVKELDGKLRHIIYTKDFLKMTRNKIMEELFIMIIII